jgi:hypothetical protein
VRGHVLEARDLRVLGRQVHDRVEDEVGDRERPVDPRRRKVADRDGNLRTAGLGAKPRHHRLRQVDPVHLDAATGERQGNPARADTELERGAAVGEPGKEVHGSLDDLAVPPAADRLVVFCSDVLSEVVLRHERRDDYVAAAGCAATSVGLPPIPHCFGDRPSTSTHVCSRISSPITSQIASVILSITCGTTSSLMRRSYSFTSISGIALSFRWWLQRA